MTKHDLSKYNLVYLATPYSKWPFGLDDAHIVACHAAGRMIGMGVAVYCPIAHSHPISKHGDIDPLSHEIWMPLDTALMKACDALAIVKMIGWKHSEGIAMEIAHFRSEKKPIYYLNERTLAISEESNGVAA